MAEMNKQFDQFEEALALQTNLEIRRKMAATTCHHVSQSQTASTSRDQPAFDDDVRTPWRLKNYSSRGKKSETPSPCGTPKKGASRSDLSALSEDSYGIARMNGPTAIKWLREHFEERDEISVPRGTLYTLYADWCTQQASHPVNQASFGKIIRAIYPHVKTRRLGTRGQSKYHYYGLGVRPTSSYKQLMGSAQRMDNNVGGVSGTHHRTQSCPALKTEVAASPPTQDGYDNSLLLKGFPVVEAVPFEKHIRAKAGVFMTMYKHHCQRILDTVLRANFAQVREFIVHFWRSLPDHVISILANARIIRMVSLCDSILYRAICQFLMPTILEPLPTGLMCAVRAFGGDVVQWLRIGLLEHNDQLRRSKLNVARQFSACLRRQTNVCHMATGARMFLHNSELSRRMNADWSVLDLRAIAKETTSMLGRPSCYPIVVTGLQEFGDLLRQQATLDMYGEWAVRVFETVTRGLQSNEGADDVSRDFLLCWAHVSRVISRELTTEGAEMFGACHLLSLLFQDYLHHLVDVRRSMQAEERLREQLFSDEIVEDAEESTFDSSTDSPFKYHKMAAEVEPEFVSPDCSPLPSPLLTSTPDRKMAPGGFNLMRNDISPGSNSDVSSHTPDGRLSSAGIAVTGTTMYNSQDGGSTPGHKIANEHTPTSSRGCRLGNVASRPMHLFSQCTSPLDPHTSKHSNNLTTECISERYQQRTDASFQQNEPEFIIHNRKDAHHSLDNSHGGTQDGYTAIRSITPTSFRGHQTDLERVMTCLSGRQSESSLTNSSPVKRTCFSRNDESFGDSSDPQCSLSMSAILRYSWESTWSAEEPDSESDFSQHDHCVSGQTTL